MRQTILLALLLGACAGLAFTALSLRAPRLDPTLPGTDSAEVGETSPASTDPSVPAPAVPPLAFPVEPRKPASSLTARVALGGFVRKVVWEPDRGEPIRGAVVRVVLAAPSGTEEELVRCVTDERGAFALEADLRYGRLPAALRLKAEKEGWTEAWSVPGLPLAIESLPYSGANLVWHMTRAKNVVPREDPPPVEGGFMARLVSCWAHPATATSEDSRASVTTEGCFPLSPEPR